MNSHIPRVFILIKYLILIKYFLLSFFSAVKVLTSHFSNPSGIVEKEERSRIILKIHEENSENLPLLSLFILI